MLRGGALTQGPWGFPSWRHVVRAGAGRVRASRFVYGVSQRCRGTREGDMYCMPVPYVTVHLGRGADCFCMNPWKHLYLASVCMGVCLISDT